MRTPTPERPFDLPRMATEAVAELRRRAPLPPGETRVSLRRTMAWQRDPLGNSLAAYARYGPIFTHRILHRPVVAMIGPEANHFVTVSGAHHFSWRRGMFGEELIPLLGDGLITTDGEYHDRARSIAMPAFHRKRMDDAVAVMVDEARRAVAALPVGGTADLYAWARDLSMSISMRALVGIDPHDRDRGHALATAFERALAYLDSPLWSLPLRGPGTPWARMLRARAELDAMLLAEIARRRRDPGDGGDILGMLLAARDDEGQGFSDGELRDQLCTMLFGGHDTSSSTISFLLHELARHPRVLARVREEERRVLGGADPGVDQLARELPELEMAFEETLRLYPPVWFGPRLAVSPFEFAGHHVPAGTHVTYSTWVSHRLPDVFPEPAAFRPERFAPEARRALPRGAYMPFGGGQRICIGKRFGHLVVKAVATVLLRERDLALPPGHRLQIDKTPTLSPRGGLRMRMTRRY
ncbi:cytochrome P450 [Patulibacter defluvii]|uniref:cytochrome P450 n=1 Tax=Patulibacter defluvii TaxID=3095358 RepID=UPI002A748C89|nr:cytochrome P450 [Patulibacter sp. DM4]